MTSLNVGDPAPDFATMASDGQPISLAQYKGKQAIVIFFYPQDNSPICVQEACSFRDAYEDFVKLGAAVIGISSNSDESHRSFAEERRLPFRLIADSDGLLRKLFGVPNTMILLPGRVTYVIDRDGIVRDIFNSQLFGAQHAEVALKVVRGLSQPAGQ